VNA
ncbi:hypothetical protein MIMGU_mgv1a0155442mg, partial [Erythranthe guttata]|jgi:small subunit ribosomal protein S19e